MGKFKLTKEQKDLIAVLPLAITKSETYQNLTDAQRLVLAQIDLQDGTDFSAENGYIYTTNEDLMKNTGISSNRTVIDAVRRLVNEGLITTKRGFRNKEGRKASEYILTDKYYKLCDRENPHTELHYMGCNNQNVGCNKDSNYTTDTDTEIEKESTSIKQIIHHCTGSCTENKIQKTKNDMIDERLVTQDEKDAWEIFEQSDGFDYTQLSDMFDMSDRLSNGLIDFDNVDRLLDDLYKSRSKEMYDYCNDRLIKYIGKFNLSESQKRVMEKKRNRWKSIEMINRHSKSNRKQGTSTVLNDCDKIIVSSDGEKEKCPSPAPQIEKKYGDYDTVEEWLTHINSKEFKPKKKPHSEITQYEVYMASKDSPMVEEPTINYNQSLCSYGQ